MWMRRLILKNIGYGYSYIDDPVEVEWDSFNFTLKENDLQSAGLTSSSEGREQGGARGR